MMQSILTSLFAIFQVQTVYAISHLNVETTSGQVKGFVNQTTPNVAHFLGIPYAEPPVGDRRWLPAQRKSKSNGTIDATQFGPACPQFDTDVNVAPNIFTVDVPGFAPSPYDYQSEDCLSVSIWAPWQEQNATQNATEPLPVIIWVYGGAFYQGSANQPYTNPSPWVERSGKHIVVNMHHRLSILAFPNAAGLKLEEQNLGLLDLRLAVEWVRDNIANFGGDPNRIVLWGQSSGSIAIDHYNFAYPDDPIVSGFIMHSGSSTLKFIAEDPEHTNFTMVAQHFGCNTSDSTEQLNCMRKVDAQEITKFIKYYSQNGTAPYLAFLPVIDDLTLFENYTARALAGNYTHKPLLIGNTANEGAGYVAYNQTYGPSQTEADAITVGFHMCPTTQTTLDRYATHSTTYRFLYAGNFSTLSPQWWEGAYHGSDVPMLFGTYGLTRGPGTEEQKETSERMQDYWVAFAEDPEDGLKKLGWDNCGGGKGEGKMFGYEGVVEQGIGEGRLDQGCEGLVWNGKAPPPRW